MKRTAGYLGYLILLGSFVLNQTFAGPAYAQERKIKVALFIDNGASIPARKAFRKEFRDSDDGAITHREVNGDDIANGALKNFDALVVPGGSAAKEARSMGAEARNEVRRFVKEGGIYLGVCAGAYLSSQAKDNDLGLIPLKTVDPEHWYRVSDGTPVDVELTQLGMEVFGIQRPNIKIIYENGPIFAAPMQEPNDGLTPLGFYRSEVVARGGKRGLMLGAPSMILARYGQGIVLAISPHPEKTPGLKEIELHAIHWMYDHKNAAGSQNASSP